MNLLLDTCTFLWIIADPAQLSAQARQLLAAPGNRFSLSVVSAWEIALKYSLGKLLLQQPPQQLVPQQRALHGIDLLSLSEAAALYLPNLPRFHRDPFDRMLICQALLDNLVILTPDQDICQYPVPTIW